MNVREALKRLLWASDQTDAWGSPGRDDDAELLAPIIEKALRAATQSGYSSGHNDARGRGPCEGSEDRGVTASVAAMVEEL